MKQRLFLLLFTGISCVVFCQTNSGKDLVFKVKRPRTTVSILPELAYLDPGVGKSVTIRLWPAGRMIGKVTFNGGNIVGKDSVYGLIAGKGIEGILSVYEKTPEGDRLLVNKVYPFRKIIIKKPGKMQPVYHVLSPAVEAERRAQKKAQLSGR